MNTLDMYTREKANKIHLQALHQEAKSRHLLRSARQDRNLENGTTKRNLRLTLAFAALVIVLGSLLLAFVMGS
jgi:hypothetical protein